MTRGAYQSGRGIRVTRCLRVAGAQRALGKNVKVYNTVGFGPLRATLLAAAGRHRVCVLLYVSLISMGSKNDAKSGIVYNTVRSEGVHFGFQYAFYYMSL